jgi:hypothetical protein
VDEDALMRIALDYDGTYTRDPVLWAKFIADCVGRGHEIICVTMRYEDEMLSDFPCEIVYTGRKGKVGFMAKRGRPVDIWIDDMPHLLMLDSDG